MRRSANLLGLIALSCCLAAGVACRSEAPDVKDSAQAALERAGIDDVNLDWDRQDQVLHMKGEVDTDEERARAEQVVTQTIGTRAKVANELTISGIDSRTADDLDGSLRSHIDGLIDADQGLKERNIDVDVNNGVVTLTGMVASNAERERAYELASKVPGVKEVVNSLQVQSQTE